MSRDRALAVARDMRESCPSSNAMVFNHERSKAVGLPDAEGDEMNDDFIAGYIRAALWSSMDESDPRGGRPMDEGRTEADLAPEARESMLADCGRFLSDAKTLGLITDVRGRMEMAGHDFWLSRNGHGSGFWDGGWEEEAGEYLHRRSCEFGEVSLYVGDDGKIHALNEGPEDKRRGVSAAQGEGGSVDVV